ncbi:MAG: alpha/beta hydrolase [Deltaproteobacteria bacterium]|nr:alpha/beta hydrolase [Deltaproteobacteria bacterium]
MLTTQELDASANRRSFINVQSKRLEYIRLPPATPRTEATPIVFLHEGLGSIALWRDFPQRVADATGCEAIVYSRYGYGKSAALQAARPVSFLHDEALQALPELLDKLQINRPILFGHSDGGSIALIHAGSRIRPVSGLIVLAPHVMVEEIGLANIQQVRENYLTTDLKQRLARYHDDPDSAFWGWNDAWLHPDFRAWNIEEYLPPTPCPVLAIQGEQDEYGTLAQLERIAAKAPEVELLKLNPCGHSPHKDQPEAVLQATRRFVNHLLGTSGLR